MDLRLHRLLPAVAALVLLPGSVEACPICFGGVDSPLLDSARLGVLAMAGLTVCVLGIFGAWFVRLARLEAAAEANAHQHEDARAASERPAQRSPGYETGSFPCQPPRMRASRHDHVAGALLILALRLGWWSSSCIAGPLPPRTTSEADYHGARALFDVHRGRIVIAELMLPGGFSIPVGATRVRDCRRSTRRSWCGLWASSSPECALPRGGRRVRRTESTTCRC